MNLITGPTGLVGTRLVSDLISSGQSVRAFSRNTSKAYLEKVFRQAGFKNVPQEIEWVEGDVLDVSALEDAMKDIKKVYHCAGFVSFGKKDTDKMMRVNIDGTANVVNACLTERIEKLCHISSIASLGRTLGENSMNEETHWTQTEANTAYAISKYGGEREVWRGIAEGLHGVIVNPAVILGPGDFTKSSGRIFSQIWKGLRVYTQGVNGYVDVRDVSRAMILLMESNIENERFILSSENVPYKKLFDSIAKNLHKPVPTILVKPWLSSLVWRLEAIRTGLFGGDSLITKESARMASGKYYYSSNKIKKALGFEFIPIEQSIAETCADFLEQKKSALR